MPPDSRPRLLLVAGPGRSGTSVTSGLLSRIGYTIPQPELGSDASNPTGFGEPKWAVWFHRQLLSEARVSHGDGRPDAAEAALVAAALPEQRRRLKRWLQSQFDISDTIVVKDPRLLWFTDMWAGVAAQLGARTVALTMLRHPAPVVKSNETHYREMPTATRVASWINGALVTEHNTRDLSRTWVEYDALLVDWKGVLEAALAPVGMPSVSTATPDQIALGDELVDPALRRSPSTWQQHTVPDYLRGLADRVYEATVEVARSGADPAAALQTMDSLREEYRELYGDSLAITRSTRKAAQSAARARGKREGLAEATGAARNAPGAEPSRPAATPPEPAWRTIVDRLVRAGRRARAARRSR